MVIVGMKRTDFKFVFAIIMVVILTSNVSAQDCKHSSNDVKVIGQSENLFRFGNHYISDQPTPEELQWLSEQGVTRVINLRTGN